MAIDAGSISTTFNSQNPLGNSETSITKFPDPHAGLANATLAKRDNANAFGIVYKYSDAPSEDSFYNKSSVTVDGTRWSQGYPYQFLIVKETAGYMGGDGKYVDPTYEYQPGTAFTLPFPPQELNLMMPFAITNTVTNGGIIEEHNGAPTRIITFAGTTGYLPLRGTADMSTSLSPLASVFSGTVNAVNTLATNATSLFTEGGGSIGQGGPITVNSNSADVQAGTGYFQFRRLQNYLEAYAALKKDPSLGRGLRLAFAIWKDQAVYLVSPITFNVTRNASSPLEYNYSFQLKAFRRIDPKIGNSYAGIDYTEFLINPQDNLSITGSILNTLSRAYVVLGNAQQVVRAVRADINRVMVIAREAILAIKSMANIATSVADFPNNIVNDFKIIVENAGEQVTASVVGKGGYLDTIARNNLNQRGAAAKSRPYSPTPNGQPITNTAPNGRPAPTVLDTIFNNPENYIEYLSQISTSSLPGTTSALRKKMDTEVNRVLQYTSRDYAERRAIVYQSMTATANAIGAGNTTFDSVYGVTEPEANRTPNPNDFNILFAMNDLLNIITRLSLPSSASKLPGLDFYSLQAKNAGVPFVMPNTKFVIPFPYGATLEQLALTYLGDANRWLEIAAINNLREPYVDETGFSYGLVANGTTTSQIIVNSNMNLYIGQPVWLQSNAIPRIKCHILNIEVKSDSNIVLTLDNGPDFSVYRVADSAYITAFLPDTVNSLCMIAIPSQKQASKNTEYLKKVPGIDPFDPFLDAGGVDLLLSQQNDLIITPDGDGRMTFGIANLSQWARIALSTPQGSLLMHPKFGLPIAPGTSIADFNANQIYAAASALFNSDPAFTQLVGSNVEVRGNAVNVSLGVGVFGQQQPLYLGVQIMK